MVHTAGGRPRCWRHASTSTASADGGGPTSSTRPATTSTATASKLGMSYDQLCGEDIRVALAAGGRVDRLAPDIGRQMQENFEAERLAARKGQERQPARGASSRDGGFRTWSCRTTPASRTGSGMTSPSGRTGAPRVSSANDGRIPGLKAGAFLKFRAPWLKWPIGAAFRLQHLAQETGLTAASWRPR